MSTYVVGQQLPNGARVVSVDVVTQPGGSTVETMVDSAGNRSVSLSGGPSLVNTVGFEGPLVVPHSLPAAGELSSAVLAADTPTGPKYLHFHYLDPAVPSDPLLVQLPLVVNGSADSVPVAGTFLTGDGRWQAPPLGPAGPKGDKGDPGVTGAPGTTDHAALTNLTAGNPHTQYSQTSHTHSSGGVIRKTAAQTLTATAQTAIADASFAVAASAKYYFIMYVAVTTSTGTAPTTAYGLTGPAGATVAVTLEQDTSTSVEASGVITAFGNFAAGAQVANTGAEVRGVIETGATAGTVQLTAARGGTTPSMVIPIGGIVGFWMRLA